jgi:hypothetical protein
MRRGNFEQIAEFDRSLKKTGEDGLKHTWAIVSAMSLWLNEVDQGPLIGNPSLLRTQTRNNADTTQATKMVNIQRLCSVWPASHFCALLQLSISQVT